MPSSGYIYDDPARSWRRKGRTPIAIGDIEEPSGEALLVGAVPLGTAEYPVPSANVLFVATNGNNANNGQESSPKRTLAGAIAAATAGDTIVVRGGVYEEYAGSISGGKTLTIQNYPGETVWFDGTDVETNWTASGGRWWAPLTVKFSHQAGHSQANPDVASRWTDAQNPVAHYTDMVFIDGQRLWQVASSPAFGQFSVDYDTDRVWIADDPGSKEVRVAKRTRFLIVNAACTIRGIGWRRYATEMYEIGAVYVGTNGANSHFEHCHMVDSATQPLALIGPGCVAEDCTIIRPGQTGIHINRSDNCIVRRNVIREHNYEKFKTEPHAGGMKITFTGNATIESNWIDGATNRAMGIWFDASCWGGKIVHNYTTGGFGGIFTEATGNMVVASNRMFGNGSTYFGFRNTISQQIEVWNNVANVANGYLFAAWQDNREITPPGERFWEEGLRGHVRDNVFCNNVMGGSHALYQFYQRKDATAPSAVAFNQMVIRFEGNVFASDPGQDPPVGAIRLAGLEPGSGVVNYNTLAAFQSAHATATGNTMTNIQAPTNANMAEFSGGVPLPAHVAAAIGVTEGVVQVGPFTPAPIPREGA